MSEKFEEIALFELLLSIPWLDQTGYPFQGKVEPIDATKCLNFESLEDNIERLERLVQHCMNQNPQSSQRLIDAEKSFKRASKALLKTISSNKPREGESHLERLQKRSQNVFKFNLRQVYLHTKCVKNRC